MTVKISTTNSKLGIIPSVNLPPVTTCRKGCPCARDCYARHGNYRFKNVKESLQNNLDAYLENPEKYFKDIEYAINNGFLSYSYFRWHAAGDIVDEKYFRGVVKVAEDLRMTSFLLFTKKFEIVNKFLVEGKTIPENLHIVYSAWGKDFQIPNPFRFPIAYVRFKGEDNSYIPSTAQECSGDCTNCLTCWNISKGESVVFNKH